MENFEIMEETTAMEATENFAEDVIEETSCDGGKLILGLLAGGCVLAGVAINKYVAPWVKNKAAAVKEKHDERRAKRAANKGNLVEANEVTEVEE